MDITPFRIHVDEAELGELTTRLGLTRWPDPSPAAAWEDGTDLEFLQHLVRHWQTDYDWRAHEAELNRLPQYTTELQGLRTHFIHQKGTGPRPFPLLLGHGWLGTNFDLRRIIPLLTDPGSHGGDPEDAFDVVAPSLPGYGFTQRPDRPGFGPSRTADLWAELMAGLGYEQYGVQSGDWGAAVAMWLSAQHPEPLVGMHLNFIPGFFRPPLGPDQPPLTAEEQAFQETMVAWFNEEGGYHRLQSTKPQTPAYALADSPAGLAAWMVEKLRGWSDLSEGLEHVFSDDELLTQVSLYWFTNTMGSSMRFYRENARNPNQFDAGQRVSTPLGVAAFPEDPTPPRSWLERVFEVTRYTEMPRGGHFGPWEEPELLAEEIRAFFRPLR